MRGEGMTALAAWCPLYRSWLLPWPQQECEGVSIICIFQEAEAGKASAQATQTPFPSAPLVSPAFPSLVLCLP